MDPLVTVLASFVLLIVSTTLLVGLGRRRHRRRRALSPATVAAIEGRVGDRLAGAAGGRGRREP